MNSASPLTPDFARRLPRWQVQLILIGFPCLYLANSFTPWSIGLFGQQDRSFYCPFWISVVVLHWLSVGATIAFVCRAGGRLSDVGLYMRWPHVVVFVGVVVAAGLALIGLRTTWPPTEVVESWQMFYPASLADRILWIFISLTAGFCEEFVYRGFGIRVLQGRGWKTWQAVLLTSVSFVFIHGIAGVFLFPVYLAFGVIFAAIFLWRKSLAPGMYVHALFDLMSILAV